MARTAVALVLLLAFRGSVPGAAASPAAAGAAPAQVAPDPRTYHPPVDAPVVDPFRPPPEPWLPGNRGLEYATVPGTLVRAIGPGVVTFAGPVAGALHVTVGHPDGLRSSYAFLAAVRVRAGDRVAGGQVVGVAADRLHLGVRRGDRYLDPASLWGIAVGGGRVVLVPLDGGGGGGTGSGGGGAAVGPPGPPPVVPEGPVAALGSAGAAALRWVGEAAAR